MAKIPSAKGDIKNLCNGLWQRQAKVAGWWPLMEGLTGPFLTAAPTALSHICPLHIPARWLCPSPDLPTIPYCNPLPGPDAIQLRIIDTI